MTCLTAFFVYVLIWWLTLFTVLPWGISSHGESGRGFDAGAPARPDLKKKLIINTVVAAVVLGIIQVLVAAGVLDWHALFRNAWK